MTTHVQNWALGQGFKLNDPDVIDLEKVAYDIEGAKKWLKKKGFHKLSPDGATLIEIIRDAGEEPEPLSSSCFTQ